MRHKPLHDPDRCWTFHPFVTERRDLIHKIDVTGGKVETRIAAAEKGATYLLADVEVVATYKLHKLNRVRLENIFHRLFGAFGMGQLPMWSTTRRRRGWSARPEQPRLRRQFNSNF